MASLHAALRGMEVRPEDAQRLAPGTALQGRVVVHGLFYGRLTTKQKVSLARSYAQDITSAIGVSMTGIRNAQGLQGRVTLGQDATGTDATFFLNLPQKTREVDVRYVLSGQSFIRSVARTTRSIVGSNTETEQPLPKLEIVPSVMQTTLPPARWQSKWPVLDVPWYVIVLLGIALLFLIVGTPALCFAKQPHNVESRGLKVLPGSGLAPSSSCRGRGLLDQSSRKEVRACPRSRHVRGADTDDPAQDPLLMAEMTSESQSPKPPEAPESSATSSSFADHVSAAKMDAQEVARQLVPAPQLMLPLPELLSLASEKAAILRSAFDAIEADPANDLTMSPSRPLLAGSMMSGLPPLPQLPQRSRPLLNLPGWLKSPRSSPKQIASQASPRIALHAQMTPHQGQSSPHLPSLKQRSQTPPLVVNSPQSSVMTPPRALTVVRPTLTRHQSVPAAVVLTLHAPSRASSHTSAGGMQKLSSLPSSPVLLRPSHPSSTTTLVQMPLQRSPSAPPLATLPRTWSVMTPKSSIARSTRASPTPRVRRPSSLGNRSALLELQLQ